MKASKQSEKYKVDSDIEKIEKHWHRSLSSDFIIANCWQWFAEFLRTTNMDSSNITGCKLNPKQSQQVTKMTLP